MILGGCRWVVLDRIYRTGRPRCIPDLPDCSSLGMQFAKPLAPDYAKAARPLLKGQYPAALSEGG